MCSRRRLLSACLVLQGCACAVPVPLATAKPRPPSPPPAPVEPPLIAAELGTEAEVAAALREHYTKYDHRIPMRDGVHLFTTVFVPKDRSRRYPILLVRTPYGVLPYGIDNYPGTRVARSLRRIAPSALFIREGYILAVQDVRGRMMSEGTFVDIRPHRVDPGASDETTDAYDTIDWLVKNIPANNGRVGAWGISYAGFYAAQAAVSGHPALKAVSPQAPVTEWFLGDDFHHNGALCLASAFDFYASFGKPRPAPTTKATWSLERGENGDGADVYDFFLALGPVANVDRSYFKGGIGFWNDMLAHPTRDAFWQARDPRPHYRQVKPAVMTVGGWFDAEDLFGSLETYRAFERQSPGADNVLVMGPWSHGGWGRSDGDRHGDVELGARTSVFYRHEIELAFFQRHLRAAPTGPTAGAGELPEAYVFETGTNFWARYSAWPPPDATLATLHLRAGGTLSASPPDDATADAAFDAYQSDPSRPVPYTAKLTSELDSDFMSADQRFATRRPDVLSYVSGKLAGDVTLTGPLRARLWVATSGTDADFVVKLVDVYPPDYPDPDPNPGGVKRGGYQQLVRGEVMRGKFRNGFETPEPFTPDTPTSVVLSLPDVSHSFRAGHRIMVQIQSSWFPLIDRNPQRFVDIYQATESDFQTATIRVYRSKDMPSGLEVTARGGLGALR